MWLSLPVVWFDHSSSEKFLVAAEPLTTSSRPGGSRPVDSLSSALGLCDKRLLMACLFQGEFNLFPDVSKGPASRPRAHRPAPPQRVAYLGLLCSSLASHLLFLTTCKLPPAVRLAEALCICHCPELLSVKKRRKHFPGCVVRVIFIGPFVTRNNLRFR